MLYSKIKSSLLLALIIFICFCYLANAKKDSEVTYEEWIEDGLTPELAIKMLQLQKLKKESEDYSRQLDEEEKYTSAKNWFYDIKTKKTRQGKWIGDDIFYDYRNGKFYNKAGDKL